ncbi:MAG: hypothetical protein H6686_06920 [Fibrobacteria bacterium]|nr:hypothetical protein [Fibrobacteria bacterium]
MSKQILGFLVFLAIALGAVWYKTQGNAPSRVVLRGLVGGEKAGFLRDEKVLDLLKGRYGIELDWSKAGSFEMVDAPSAGLDFLWPSSQTALEAFRVKNPDPNIKSDVIFNSPLVLFSWDIVVDALVKEKIVETREGTHWIVDFPRLAELVVGGRKWSDIGLANLYGRVNITTTDPALSNSGHMFVGLLSTVLQGDVVTDANVDSVLPRVVRTIKALGFMERSSGDLFLQYLNTGVGAKPIIAGYESQIVEFAIDNEKTWPSLRQTVRVMYPEPTVWSAHPLIALSPGGAKLLKALKDPDLQKIAWERHGFRTGIAEVRNDPERLSVLGIPERITRVVAMPEYRVMEKLVQAIQAP